MLTDSLQFMDATIIGMYGADTDSADRIIVKTEDGREFELWADVYSRISWTEVVYPEHERI